MERYSTLIDLILYELRFFLNVYEMLEKQPCGQSSITSNLSSIIRQDASYPSICSAFALRLYIMSTFKPRSSLFWTDVIMHLSIRNLNIPAGQPPGI